MNKLTRFQALKVLEWCKKKYGRGRERYPYLEYRKADYTALEVTMAEYDYEEGTMMVYSDRINTIEELVHTIIHEYCHYRYHTKSKMWKSDEQYSYEENPYEIEADSIANRDWKKCLKELKKYYTQFNF